jgi:hypothetical protein
MQKIIAALTGSVKCKLINSLIFKIVKNMYSTRKSRIFQNVSDATFSDCSCGLYQGENFSPVLLALFQNDLIYKQKFNRKVKMEH